MNEPVINPNGRGVSTQSTSSLKDLVFNPETGDFEQIERGTANEGDTVTKMTEDGFALTLEDGFCAPEHRYSGQQNEAEDENHTLDFPEGKDLMFNPETGEFEVVDRPSIKEDKTIDRLPYDSFC